VAIRLTRSPLSVARAYDELGDEASGGVVVFVGRVRPDTSARGTVRALFYEADRPLALRSLRSLRAEAVARFGARRVVLHHRVGVLAVGVPSIIVGVAAPHRRAAFAAAEYLIRRLKRETPIWKTDRVRPASRPPRPRGRRGAQRAG